MYEMYPDNWLVLVDRQTVTGDKPRRRARKEHSVLPDVIALQVQPLQVQPLGVQQGADLRRPPYPGR